MEVITVKRIKFSYILLSLSALIILILSLNICKQCGYKQSIRNLFGKDNYIVVLEDTDESHTKIYTLDNKEVDGHKVFEDYMETYGYHHSPDEQLGMLHIFRNKDGKCADCDENNENRGYLEWDIWWN